MAEKFISPEPQPEGYERELLDLIIEECSEIIQRATKAQRFGLREVQPGQHKTNVERLSLEIGDLEEVLGRAVEARIVDVAFVREGRRNKHAQLNKFLQHEPV